MTASKAIETGNLRVVYLARARITGLSAGIAVARTDECGDERFVRRVPQTIDVGGREPGGGFLRAIRDVPFLRGACARPEMIELDERVGEIREPERCAREQSVQLGLVIARRGNTAKPREHVASARKVAAADQRRAVQKTRSCGDGILEGIDAVGRARERLEELLGFVRLTERET